MKCVCQELTGDPIEEEDPIDDDDAADNYTEYNEGDNIDEDLDDEDESEELATLNRQLDQLDEALDSLEQKNDHIHEQLKELLADSRKVLYTYQLPHLYFLHLRSPTSSR